MKRRINLTPWKIEIYCAYCGKLFERFRTKSHGHRKDPGVRSVNCSTCCKKCTRKYLYLVAYGRRK